MKKVILFLSVIGVTLLMTSCLGEGSNNYTDSSFVYVDTDDRGTTYGKTFSRYSPTRFIIHSSMMTMNPGTFKAMAYGWDEENGTTAIIIDGQTVQVDNVQLLAEVVDITRTSLNMTELPEPEDPKGFNEIATPLYSDYKDFMADHWVIEYAYTAKKGQKANVEFYKRDEEVNGEIIIDVHLTLSGTPDGDSDVGYADAIALNMSQLRAMNSAKEELKIKFKYYKKGSGDAEPVETDLPSQQNAYTWKIGAAE